MYINRVLWSASVALLIIVGVLRLEPLPGDDDDDPNELPRITYQQIAEDVLTLLARGEKINAIRRVQALTGLGSKDAKVYVEGLQAKRQL